MACGSLTYGFDYECNDGIGGIKPGSILIAQWDNVEAGLTVVNGEITVLTQVALTNFYRYEVRKFIASDTTNGVNDPKSGTVSYTSNFVFSLFNMSNSKNVQLELIASKPIVVIYQDSNDIYHCLGITNGAEAVTLDRQSGLEKQELNGYTITIMAEEKVFPYTVLASVVTGLTISGSLS